MTSSSQLRSIIDNPNDSTQFLLVSVIGNAISQRATDVYIREGLPLVHRIAGKLVFAVGVAGVDHAGAVDTATFGKLVDFLIKKSHSEKDYSFTHVFTLKENQVRIQYSAGLKPRQLQLRIQPIAPYPLDSFVGQNPKLTAMLNKASGLFLVCGAIGSGKTSLMTSIAEFWAKGPSGGSLRHVVTLGDPVEYVLPADRYVVSYRDCALTEVDKAFGKPFISDIMPDVLRSDIDALCVGEVREVGALQACMQFSASKEPLITTIHAASIADCLVRVIGMAEQAFSPATARLLLASCLEGVFFVNIAYTDKDEAVPVVEFLSTQSSTALRNAIAEGSTKDLVRRVEDELRQGKHETYITRSMAVRFGQARGLSEAEATAALGKTAQE